MTNIILIGFMGCGKSTFGKWLADKQNMVFVDTDCYIEEEQKQTINDIFATRGETYFRDLETRTIKDFLGLNGKDKALDRSSVISVGGGLVVREENVALLKKLGTIVYLDTSIDELVRRLEDDNTRPLLKGSSIRERINTLMEARQDIYEDAADIIVSTDNKTMYEIYEELMEEWEFRG